MKENLVLRELELKFDDSLKSFSEAFGLPPLRLEQLIPLFEASDDNFSLLAGLLREGRSDIVLLLAATCLRSEVLEALLKTEKTELEKE